MATPVKYLVYTSPGTFDTCALVSGSLASTLGAVLSGLMVENTNAATRWIQVFDSAAAPSGGTVPLLSLKVGATSQESVTLPVTQFKNGIVIATSTTGPTYTAGSTDMFVTAWWSFV